MKKRILTVIMLFLLLLTTSACRTGGADIREEVVISIPYSRYIRNLESNYYKTWLEEQTGLSIKFNVVYETLTADYLRAALASGYVHTDAYFSIFGDEDDPNAVLQEFGEKGYIIPLGGYVDQSVHLNAIFEEYPQHALREAITSTDGNIYYMPAFDPSVPETNEQVLWINQRWLKQLDLGIPQTTEDLRDVLTAFKTRDPNGNGLLDEIPLSGSNDVVSEASYNFIINAFVYNDPANSRLFLENGAVRFAPVTEQWREAMQYLAELYADGLISPFQFELGHSGLVRLANDPWDLLGGFASQSISDVIFPSNTELANGYVHVMPLAGPEGTRRTTIRTPRPKPGGVITSECANPEAVFRLLDLMLSEEAFQIGRYGEEGVDWVPASVMERNYYGETATVKIINLLRGAVQNKNLNELGPFYAHPEYADGVTFSSNDVDPGYIDARAYRIYDQYKPEEYLSPVSAADRPEILAIREAIDSYTTDSIRAFVTGGMDPSADADWQAHVDKYAGLGLDRLIEATKEQLS